METLARSALSYLMAGGFLTLLAMMGYHNPSMINWFEPVQSFLPIFIISTALLLGWRFDRSRLVFITVLISVSALLLERPYLLNGAAATVIHASIWILLPLNIALLSLLKERGIFSAHGLIRWAWLIIQPGLLIALWYSQWQINLYALSQPLIDISILNSLAIPQLALFTFLISLVICAATTLGQHRVMEKAIFWSLVVICFIALNGITAPDNRLFFSIAVLIPLIAVIEISYTMAFRDELTELPGRRALNQALLRLGKRYTVAMLDIDHFKKFNDTYGHDVGDQVLRMVAVQIKKTGGGAKAFRYGGEEFTLLFPGKSTEDALPHLESLRELVASTPFSVRDWTRPSNKPETPKEVTNTEEVQITVSIGVSEPEGGENDPHNVIKLADTGLYHAKDRGRNKVSL